MLIVKMYVGNTVDTIKCKAKLKIPFASNNETVTSYTLKLDKKNAYIATNYNVYNLEYYGWRLRTLLNRADYADYPIIHSVGISKNGLIKLEMCLDRKKNNYICTLTDGINVTKTTLKKGHHIKDTVIISDDGSIGAIINGNTIDVWDLRTIKHIFYINGSNALLSPKGEILLIPYSDAIYIFDIPPAEPVKILRYEKIKEIHSIDISRDGKTIIASYHNVFCTWNI